MEIVTEAVKEDEKNLLSLIDPFIVPVLAERNVCFIREVSFAMGWHDPNFLIDWTFGLPAHG